MDVFLGLENVKRVLPGKSFLPSGHASNYVWRCIIFCFK